MAGPDHAAAREADGAPVAFPCTASNVARRTRCAGDCRRAVRRTGARRLETAPHGRVEPARARRTRAGCRWPIQQGNCPAAANLSRDGEIAPREHLREARRTSANTSHISRERPRTGALALAGSAGLYANRAAKATEVHPAMRLAQKSPRRHTREAVNAIGMDRSDRASSRSRGLRRARSAHYRCVNGGAHPQRGRVHDAAQSRRAEAQEAPA